MELYKIADLFSENFDDLERYDSYEPDKDENGNYIDSDGSVIKDPKSFIEKVKEDLKLAWLESMLSLEEDYEDKVLNTAMYIKNIEAEAEAIAREKKRLDTRQKSLENRAKWLKSYIAKTMEQVGRTRVDLPQACITLKNTQGSLKIDDEERFVEWAIANERDDLLTYSKPKIAKSKVRLALEDEQELPNGVSIVSSKSVVIK